MGMTNASATNSLATTPVIALSGVARVRADGLSGQYLAKWVDIYEESVTDDTYVPVVVPSRDGKSGEILRLTTAQPSVILEGYGNYKFVISAAGIEVGYVAG